MHAGPQIAHCLGKCQIDLVTVVVVALHVRVRLTGQFGASHASDALFVIFDNAHLTGGPNGGPQRACFLSLGYISSVNSVRRGDISFTAPFRYTVLIFAIALQIIVFGDVPDVFTFIGSAIVGAAGLYALANETRSQPAT